MPVCLGRSMDALERIWETINGVKGDDGREQCQEGHEASVDASSRKSRCAKARTSTRLFFHFCARRGARLSRRNGQSVFPNALLPHS